MSECSTFSDRKTAGPQTLYLAQGFGVPGFVAHLESSCNVKVQLLPYMIPPMGQSTSPQQIPANIQPPGLLYLPNPYVVPGGRFNEMYGWDSYFIIRGLIRAGKLELARGIVRNFFFEIDHYGGVLNANRTYYLTRSQPPFLTSMILAIYASDKSAASSRSSATKDRQYLPSIGSANPIPMRFAITRSGSATIIAPATPVSRAILILAMARFLKSVTRRIITAEPPNISPRIAKMPQASWSPRNRLTLSDRSSM